MLARPEMNDRPRYFLFRLVFFFSQAPVGILLPFFVLHLDRVAGLTYAQISVLQAVFGLSIILFSQFWGYLADVHLSKKALIILTGALGAACFGMIGWQNSFLPILFWSFLFYAIATPTVQLVHSFLFDQRDSEHRFGLLRAYGSLGFVVVNLLVGLVSERYFNGGLAFIFPLYAIITVAMILLLFPIPKGPTVHREPLTFMQVQTFFMRQPAVMIFLLAACFYQGGHAIAYNLQALLMQELGADRTMIAMAYSLAAVLELPVFLASHWLIKRFGEMRLMLFAALVQTIRWILVWHADSPMEIVTISMLHCITFGLFYASAVRWMNSIAGERLKASSQTLFALVYLGIATMIGSIGGAAVVAGGAVTEWNRRLVEILLRVPARGDLHDLYIACAVTSAISAVILGGLVWKFSRPDPDPQPSALSLPALPNEPA